MSDQDPLVLEIALRKHYAFMYENLVIATQSSVYLLLQKQGDMVDVLYFDSNRMKYGSPNDEARFNHPMMKYGLGFFGFFEVKHSPWVKEQMVANRVHPKHHDSLFDGYRHFIACFKDVMLEVTSRTFEEKQMSVAEIEKLVRSQLKELSD